MKLHVDLGSGSLLEGPGLRDLAAAPRFKRGDAVPLEVVFLTDGRTPAHIGDPAALSIHFGLKAGGRYDLGYLAHESVWTMPEPDDPAPVYRCLPSFNTGEMNDALRVGGATELDELEVMGEISWHEGSAEPTSTRTFAVIVENDVNRGNEGAPTTANLAWESPALGSPGEILTPDGAGRAIWADPAVTLNINRGRRRVQAVESDFWRVEKPVAEFYNSGLASGTLVTSTTIASTSHPGILIIRNSTTAMSGGWIGSDAGGYAVGGGEKFTLVFRPQSQSATCIARFGLLNIYTGANPTRGVYMQFVGNGAGGNVASGVCVNSGGSTVTPTTCTIPTGAWYTAVVEVAADAASATFSIFSEAGSLLWSSAVAANIPAPNETLGAAINAVQTAAGVAVEYMLMLDYMSFEVNRDLVR